MATLDRSWRDLLAEGRLPRFALICLGVWLNAADALVTATIMPSVGLDLGGYGYFGWATAGYFTGCILAGATAGRLAEMFSLRSAICAAGLVYAAGCALSARAPDISLFLAGRLLQGIGAGWISGFAYVAVGLLFPERHLPRVFAAISGIWGLATLVGPLVGGLFAAAGGWRGVFWMFAGQAAAFSAAALWLTPRAGRRDSSAAGVPLAQLGLLAAGVAALAVSGLKGGAGSAIGLGAAGLAFLWAAVRLDARSPVRLFPREAGALATPVGAGFAAIFTSTAASMGLSIYGPAVLQTLRGLSPLAAGYVVGAEALGWTLIALLVANAQDPWRDRCVRLGAVCVAVSAAVLAWALRDGPLWSVIAASTLMGAGFGLSWSFISQRMLTLLPDAERAVGASSLVAVRQTGSAAGAALAGAAANLAGASADVFTRPTAEAVAVWVFAASVPPALLGVWASWRLTRRGTTNR
ncbi:MFS transporter [Phenylobacterium sp.]|uniref:MFS transporter n=1 Tax=Phenylobacterium sp. TaxID=1871053 RepID=UPI002F41B01F